MFRKPPARVWSRGVAISLVSMALGATLVAAQAPTATTPVAPFPIEEVAPGQRGYGLSVFEGSEPIRFEVEVVGVIENMRPGTSFVLARLSGRGLEETGVVAGMSGSPVYIDDRLVGAVAFGWPFSIEAIAGITPISSMRAMKDGPPAPSSATSFGAGDVELGDLLSRELVSGARAEEMLAEQLAALQPRLAEGARSGLQWSLSGFAPRTRAWLDASLGSVSGGGTTDGGGVEALAPGGAVAGVLIDGDLRMAATGTVTDRLGDVVLAFGHPFLGLGPTNIPMATAEVVTILGSEYSSFKISNVGEVVGAFNLDRAPGIRGEIGLEAPTLPLAIDIESDRDATYALELADIPSLTPTLAAIGLISCLDETTQVAGRTAVDLHARFDLGERGELVVRRSFDGDNGGTLAAIHLLSFTAFLKDNAFGEVDLRSIDVDLDQYPEPRTLRLVGAHASQRLVRPGDTLTLNLELADNDGNRSRRSVEVHVPTGIPAGRFSLFVGDGVSADAARLAIEPADPVTLEQALELLRSLHSNRELVVLGVFPESGLAVAGEVMPQLPASMRSIWGAAASGTATPVTLAIAQQQVEPLDLPLEGLLRVDLEVRRREPLSPTRDSGGGGDASAGPGGAGGAGSGRGSAMSEKPGRVESDDKRDGKEST